MNEVHLPELDAETQVSHFCRLPIYNQAQCLKLFDQLLENGKNTISIYLVFTVPAEICICMNSFSY